MVHSTETYSKVVVDSMLNVVQDRPRFMVKGPPCFHPRSALSMEVSPHVQTTRYRCLEVVVISAAFVSRRLVDTKIHPTALLLRKFLQTVKNNDEREMNARELIAKAAKVTNTMKHHTKRNLAKGDVRDFDDNNVLLLFKVISQECLDRISEFWDFLREFYCPKPIAPKITISELNDVMVEFVSHTKQGRAIPANKTIPKFGTTRAATRGKDFEVIAYNVLDITPETHQNEKVNDIIDRIGHHLRIQVVSLGYAMRRYNSRSDENSGRFILFKDVLEDFASMDDNLPIERAAAVNHVSCITMIGKALGVWLDRGIETMKDSPNETLRNHVRILKSWKEGVMETFDIPEEIFLRAGFHVGRAENAIYDDMKKRNSCFSMIRNFTTAMGESQYPHKHIPGYDKPLKFGDGR